MATTESARPAGCCDLPLWVIAPSKGRPIPLKRAHFHALVWGRQGHEFLARLVHQGGLTTTTHAESEQAKRFVEFLRATGYVINRRSTDPDCIDRYTLLAYIGPYRGRDVRLGSCGAEAPGPDHCRCLSSLTPAQFDVVLDVVNDVERLNRGSRVYVWVSVVHRLARILSTHGEDVLRIVADLTDFNSIPEIIDLDRVAVAVSAALIDDIA